MAKTSHVGKADQETKLKSGTPASNPSFAKPHGFQSRDRTVPPCSRSGCRCLLAALPWAWTQLQTPHSCPSTSPLHPGELQHVHQGGLIGRDLFQTLGISTFLNYDWFLTHTAGILHRPGTLQNQTPAYSTMPLVAPNTASAISVQKKPGEVLYSDRCQNSSFSPGTVCLTALLVLSFWELNTTLLG